VEKACSLKINRGSDHQPGTPAPGQELLPRGHIDTTQLVQTLAEQLT
jgi:hypothetical protein